MKNWIRNVFQQINMTIFKCVKLFRDRINQCIDVQDHS